MSIIREISDIGAVLSWSPVRAQCEGASGETISLADTIAVGTKEGGGGGFDDYGGELSFHSLGLYSDNKNTLHSTEKVASIKTSARFSSISWGAVNRPQGLVVGGMSDGVVNVWDPSKIIGGKSANNALLTEIKRHKGSVNSIQFNPHKSSSHLFASGSSNGDVLITNLQRPESPSIAPPTTNQSPAEAEITSIAWNSGVPHILASATATGTCSVWNLRENRPWAVLRDPQRNPISSLAWNPVDGVYLITATNDDTRPVLRVWDLRSNTTTPLTEFREHSRGILSMSWCPNDPSYLITTGKDNQTLLWDITSGISIAELPASVNGPQQSAPVMRTDTNQNNTSFSGGMFDMQGPSGMFGSAMNAGSIFGGQPAPGQFDTNTSFGGGGNPTNQANRRYDIQWSPHIRGVAATCSFDRKIHIYNVNAVTAMATNTASCTPIGTATEASQSDPAAARKLTTVAQKTPNWLRPPAAMRFGYGGRGIMFGDPAASMSALNALRAKSNGRIDFDTLPQTLHGAANFLKHQEMAVSQGQPAPVPPRTISIVEPWSSEGAPSCYVDSSLCSSALQLYRVIFGVSGVYEAPLQHPLEVAVQQVEEFCSTKVTEAEKLQNHDDASMWAFIRIICTSQEGPRKVLQKYLGYDTDQLAKLAKEYAGKDFLSDSSTVENVPVPDSSSGDPKPTLNGFDNAQGLSSNASAADVFGSSNDGEDGGFHEFSEDKTSKDDPQEKQDDTTNNKMDHKETLAETAALKDMYSFPPNSQTDNDPKAAFLLRRAVLVGDFRAAVSVAFKMGRYSEGLLFAACGDPELWNQARAEYLKITDSGFSHLLGSIASGDLANLIKTAPLHGISDNDDGSACGGWRELLALLCAYSEGDEFVQLAEALGDRLLADKGGKHNNSPAAVLCYICANSVSKAVPVWVAQVSNSIDDIIKSKSESKQSSDDSLSSAIASKLHEALEKVFVLRRAISLQQLQAGTLDLNNCTDGVARQCFGQAQQSAAEALLLARYSILLAQEGQSVLAVNFARGLQRGIATGDPFNCTDSAPGQWLNIESSSNAEDRKYSGIDQYADTVGILMDRLWHGMPSQLQQFVASMQGFAHGERNMAEFARAESAYTQAQAEQAKASEEHDVQQTQQVPSSQVMSGENSSAYTQMPQASMQSTFGSMSMAENVFGSQPASGKQQTQTGAMQLNANQFSMGDITTKSSGIGMASNTFAMPSQTSGFPVTSSQPSAGLGVPPARNAVPNSGPNAVSNAGFAQPQTYGNNIPASGGMNMAQVQTHRPNLGDQGTPNVSSFAAPQNMQQNTEYAGQTNMQQNTGYAGQTNMQQNTGYAGQTNMPQTDVYAQAKQRKPSKFTPQADGFVSSAGDPVLGSKYNNLGSFSAQETQQTPVSYPTVPGVGFGNAPSAAPLNQFNKFGLPNTSTAGAPEPAPAPAPAPVLEKPVPQDIQQAIASLSGIFTYIKQQGVSGMESKQLAQGEAGLTALETLYRHTEVGEDAHAAILEMGQAASQYQASVALRAVNKVARTRDWTTHKDWIKGVKHGLTLAAKRFQQ